MCETLFKRRKGREEGGKGRGRDLQKDPPYAEDQTLNPEASMNPLKVNSEKNHSLCFILKIKTKKD